MIDQERFFDALHATWPPAQTAELDGWRVRQDVNGGKRVSAASGSGDVATAEAAMRALGQDSLFRLTSDDESLDAKLEARGYDVVDPTLVYAARVNMLTDIPSGERSADSRVESSSGRTKAHEAMWEKGGIGPGKWAVMDRVVVPKRFLLARVDERPAGTAFVGANDAIFMVHTIEVLPAFRRRGAARVLIQAAARFAAENRADLLFLVVLGVERPGHRALRGARHANGRAVPLPASWQTLSPHGRMLRMMKSDRNACTTRIAANAQRARVLNASA